MCQQGCYAPKGVDCEIPHRLGEGIQTFLKTVWKPLPSRGVLKVVRLTTIRNEPKWIIFTSGGLEMLQKISESITRRGASEDTGP